MHVSSGLHDLQLNELMKDMKASRHNNVFKLVIPSPADIHTDPGDDVTLSCHLSMETSVVAMEVKWLKRTDCIYLYKNGQGTEGRGYEGRVSILTEDLQRGNVSLRLRHVTHSESGIYRCQVIHGDFKLEETLWLYVKTIQDEKVPLRRVHSASVYIKPSMAGRGTSETPPEHQSVPTLRPRQLRRDSIRQRRQKTPRRGWSSVG
ncbi:butyrophilin-like protein 2 isoform X2 [Alosa alosa]|uniref:butyrophilin-like protein 2 isoform X2 n=1 Tax=Alosa alosa TaxID=278164 RepID=UPI0020151669|nr:butyrophilin-like protein 2 isoform X2 [Alosa alosa]